MAAGIVAIEGDDAGLPQKVTASVLDAIE